MRQIACEFFNEIKRELCGNFTKLSPLRLSLNVDQGLKDLKVMLESDWLSTFRIRWDGIFRLERVTLMGIEKDDRPYALEDFMIKAQVKELQKIMNEYLKMSTEDRFYIFEASLLHKLMIISRSISYLFKLYQLFTFIWELYLEEIYLHESKAEKIEGEDAVMEEVITANAREKFLSNQATIRLFLSEFNLHRVRCLQTHKLFK